MLTLTTLMTLLACAPEPLVSTPSEPTVELDTKREETVTWKTLEGLLTKEKATFPTVVSGLKLGQPEADARAVLEAAKHTKLLAPPEKDFDNLTVVSALLQDYPAVGVTLMLRDGLLAEVDVSLPKEEALFALNESWGAADLSEIGAASIPVPVWVGAPMRARLLPTDKPQSILKYSTEE